MTADGTIAALFVERDGAYANLPGVELWDISKDARKYRGPHPVVAHPPCARWCRLAGFVESRWGHKRGDDGGCFESALRSVIAYGGVLEHPAYSSAWDYFSLPHPRKDGWTRALDGSWVCHVEQRRYGHVAKKATWLFAYGVVPLSMRWGVEADTASTSSVSWCGNKTKSGGENRKRVGAKLGNATPVEFRDALIALARTCVSSSQLRLQRGRAVK